jgi:hypothetical protein
MAKRLTDSKKWDDDWFLSLPPEHKLLWIYMLDKCDHAGVFKVTKKLAEFCLGIEIGWERAEAAFMDRIVKITEDKWFIPKFLTFQYGKLNPNNKIHSGIIAMLKARGIDTLSIEYANSNETAKVKVKVKVKDKVKVNKEKIPINTKTKYAEFVNMTEEQHNTLIKEHGESATKRMIEILDNYKGSSGKTYKDDYRAIKNWVVGRYNEEMSHKKGEKHGHTGHNKEDRRKALDAIGQEV